MQNLKHMTAVGLNGDVTKRSSCAGNRVTALWRTVIGKKIVMAANTTFTARVVIWPGVLLAVFIVFHHLHLSGGIVGFKAGQFQHLAVYQNAVAAFHAWPVTVFYIVVTVGLCLHLGHVIWSKLQTLGWSTARNETMLKAVSCIIAIAVFAGLTSVPVAVITGLLH